MECGRRHAHPLSAGEWRGRAPVRRAAASSSSSPACDAVYRRFLASTSRGFSQGWSHAYINDVSLYGYSALVSWDAVGSENWHQKQYLQREDVKAALHVEASPATQAGRRQVVVHVILRRAAAAAPGSPSMVLLPRVRQSCGRRCSTTTPTPRLCEGTRDAIYSVGFPEVDGGSYRPWFFNATAATYQVLWEKDNLFGPDLTLRGAGVQFGGHVVNFEHNLSFATVHGSGHMVPQFRPRASLHMIEKLVALAPLAPPLAGAAKLANMSEGEFDSYLDAWTVGAQAAPYVVEGRP